jgi:hypothetical protein
MFDNTAKATVQPVSIDFVKVKQALMKADQLYTELNGLTNADQTDDSMSVLVRALYHHSEHYKDALKDSNDMYSTYRLWSSMYKSLKNSPDVHAISTCSEYLKTALQVQKWQEQINSMTTLLRSLEHDSSVDDSCKQICNRIVRKLKEATDLVQAVAPSEELSRQLDAYVNSQYHQVQSMYRSTCFTLQELEVQLGSTSRHYTSIQELLQSLSAIRISQETCNSVAGLCDSLSNHITQSQRLLRSLEEDGSVDIKLIKLCDSIVSQIKKANTMLIPVTADQVSA